MQSSLIRKVFLGTLIYIMMLVLVATVAINYVTTFGHTIAVAIEGKTQRSQLVSQFNTQLGRMLSAAQQYMLFGQTADLREADVALTLMASASSGLEQAAGNSQLAVYGPEAQAQAQVIRQQRAELLGQSQQLLTAIKAQAGALPAPEQQRLRAIQAGWGSLIELTERAQQNNLQILIEIINNFANAGIVAIIGSVMLLLLTLGLLLIALQRSVVVPIKQLASAAHAVGAGDLSQTIQVSGKDEISELQCAFNTMTSNLREQRQAFQLRAEAEQARIAAEEASKAKSSFLANMSHELRTPLSSIIGYSELLQSIATEPSQLELVPDIQKIQQAGRHLLSIINDVLDLSKIEAGKMYLVPEALDVAGLVEDVASTIRPLMEKNHNTFIFQCAPGLGTLYTDGTKLRQVLLNLLSNAAKFTEHGVVTLVAETQPGAIHFTVKDTGIGMSPEQIKRLFLPFTQASDKTSRLYGGTGLGLTLSQHLCRMMGGEIEVVSEPGSGSYFTVKLPLSEVAALPVRPEPVLAEPQPVAIPLTNESRLVLVIDDDPAARDLITRSLDPNTFTVVTATDGEQGLQLARDLLPDVIILDVLMPAMDGWTVLSELKSEQTLADIPVIMLTIVDEQAVGFALGATDYLIKPISGERLSNLLLKYKSQITATPPQPSRRVLIVEDDHLTRDLLRRTIVQSGCDVAEAATGAQAVAQIEASAPDLSIIDLTLPDMDGIEVIDAIRAQTANRATPIIVITAKDLSASEREHLNKSVSRILGKGMFRREELLDEVRRLLALHLDPSPA